MSRYTKPEWSKSVLITIDTQCDTLQGQPFEIPGTSKILPRMQALLQTYREVEKPIIHIVRIYKADGSNVDLCRRELIERGAALVLVGSSGCQLPPELLPYADVELDADLLLSGGIQKLSSNEVAIYKPRWGAFYNTPLEHYLRELGVSTVVFSGCNFPNCPRASIYEASERDFRVVLVEDAISGLYEQGRQEMNNIGVELIPADQVVDAVR
jgi:nicotinamidase-related amidase